MSIIGRYLDFNYKVCDYCAEIISNDDERIQDRLYDTNFYCLECCNDCNFCQKPKSLIQNCENCNNSFFTCDDCDKQQCRSCIMLQIIDIIGPVLKIQRKRHEGKNFMTINNYLQYLPDDLIDDVNKHIHNLFLK